MLKSMPVFFAVLRSASSSSVRTSGARASARPITLKRMLLRSSVSSSRPQIALEQHHQRADFSRGTLPVLDGKGVEGEDFEAEPRRGLDDVPDRVDAGAMPLDARQVPLAGPAAVAVHDDGDVAWQAIEFDLAGQRLFRPAGGNPLQ